MSRSELREFIEESKRVLKALQEKQVPNVEEVTPAQSSDGETPLRLAVGTDTAALPLTQAPATTDQPQVAIQADTDTKVCPYCAETIKAKAIKCRYCGSELEPLTAVAEVPAATEAKNQFNVILVSAGENWISVIKEIRAITGFDLNDAKALVDTAPSAVKADVGSEEAARIKKQLEDAGAEVEVEQCKARVQDN